MLEQSRQCSDDSHSWATLSAAYYYMRSASARTPGSGSKANLYSLYRQSTKRFLESSVSPPKPARDSAEIWANKAVYAMNFNANYLRLHCILRGESSIRGKRNVGGDEGLGDFDSILGNVLDGFDCCLAVMWLCCRASDAQSDPLKDPDVLSEKEITQVMLLAADSVVAAEACDSPGRRPDCAIHAALRLGLFTESLSTRPCY